MGSYYETHYLQINVIYIFITFKISYAVVYDYHIMFPLNYVTKYVEVYYLSHEIYISPVCYALFRY